MRRGAALAVLLAATSAGWPVLCPGQENAAEIAMYQQGLQRADTMLNQNYQQVIASLDPVAHASLKSMQRSWIVFKEADFAIFTQLAHGAGDDAGLYGYEANEENEQAESLRTLGKPNAMAEARFRRETVSTSQQADLLLNTLYHQLMPLMPPDTAGAEKTAQAAWIRFRDLYCQLDASLKGGTVDDAVLRDLTLRRTAQLGRYIKMLVEMKLPATASDPTDDPDETPTDPPPADPFRFAK